MLEEQPLKIIGTLEKIVFKNPDNDYFIGKLRSEEKHELITIVGHMIEIQPGERISITGKWVENKKYGLQLEIASFEVIIPTTTDGIEKYLGSGLIKGIGPVTAGRIVSEFGIDTLKILDSEPERLLNVGGFARKRLELIKKEWKKQQYIREIMIFMHSYGISNSCAAKIYKKYGNNSISILKSNPYRLIEDVSGIGFKTADKIAENLGIEKESDFRLQSGIVYLLNEITDSGNCYYPHDEIIRVSMELLNVGELKIIEAIGELKKQEKIIITDNAIKKVYLKNIYDAELYVSNKLMEIRDYKEVGAERRDMFSEINSVHDTGILNKINQIASESNIELNEDQIEAVKKSVKEKVLVITGSPGTGKSTILNIVIKFFEQYGKSVVIGAPTGRASKRLNEATGKDAKTIHRLLKYQPKINRFLKNEQNQIESNLVIIDEASMLDIGLFKSLLEAVNKNSNLILVGDIDQLPAVGPGNVLADIINSEVFSVVRLETIYRQGGKSQIIYNAHRIRDGIYPVIKRSEYNDFFFIEKILPEQVISMILYLITERIPSTFNYDPCYDIQVIVPTNKGIVGVNNLNTKIQEKLNKNKIGLVRGANIYKLNDRVIQLKNNYEKEVYNGDIGFINNIDFEMKEITVDYDGKYINYDFSDLDELSLSYAITIHKSQGSEFKCVIIPILTSHYMLLQRNLLYTALTRAIEVAVIVGSKKAVGIAVNKNVVEKRYTSLRDFLLEES
ncbi:MAG: ATP-dependent RecD-like DNA helicase [Actinobacteria bacterium]|nr:ATP-dependent RecD-like DNA helicase [Actinomycetota bacterium]